VESHSAPCIVLMADDDEEDRLLAKIAFEAAQINGEIHFVEDGIELMEYLKNAVNGTSQERAALPNLIFLDLNMPRMGGREALKKIKTKPGLKDIPVVILTTSRNETDVNFCMNAGARDFITKPVELDDWIDVIAAPLRSHCSQTGCCPNCSFNHELESPAI